MSRRSNLPVRGFEAVLFAVATDFANAIVGAAEAMTIKARKIRDLLQELPGALSVLRSRNGLTRTHVPTLGGDKSGCQTLLPSVKIVVSPLC